jgi:hypothetical protein
MSKDPDEAVEEVVDEESFIEFVGVLAANRSEPDEMERQEPNSVYGRSKNGWEHGSIEAFLDAACRWGTQSINGMPLLPKSTNPWRRCADVLLAGKFYE